MTQAMSVFWAFLKLGCTSFGGPIAHLIYFRAEFVERRNWLTEHDYSLLLALCQTLPGPASSQVGFAIGLHRAGLLGGIAAFIAFTLPSICLLLVFAHFLYWFDTSLGVAALKGLAILALVVVLQGVLAMGKTLCSNPRSFGIASLSFVCLLLFESIYMQLGVIALGMILGYLLLINDDTPHSKGNGLTNFSDASKNSHKLNRSRSIIAIAILIAGFVVLPLTDNSIMQGASDFYRSGALVFGGGHVVLPLLEEATVANGLLTQDLFLAGYGATQALPGPMFSFASYLGWLIEGDLSGALWASLFIFLPGFLLIIACLPYWQMLSQNKVLIYAFSGANAAVVGLLAATLYSPIFTHAITSKLDLAIAALAFTCLTRLKIPVLVVVALCISLSMGATWL